MEQTQEPSQENGGEAFCEQVLAINRRVFENTGSQPLAFIRTYGCQQNASDSERLGGMLARMGYGFTENAQNADLVLFNTCAVREHAEQRVFGNVGALKPLKQLRPSVIIGLCGCMVQQEHIVQKLRKSYPYVDLVFGTHALQRLPELLYRVMTQEGRVYETPEADDGIAEGLPVRRSGGVKAWLHVMYGCNNFCSYCIVPYVRGREKSRRPEAVLAQATQLASEGCREITLLGQNVNSYGNDLSVGYDFARLLREINDIDGDFRIRFMTSHPKDATRALFSAMAD
ncbi:MAG: MiaB/RimO family radical SAM methylthiotransferase, partial [Clostridia bacterium]|nr:MiaB/RimO family radical SAM methylthiotransferase [Clostridia bacterium]